VFWNDHALHGRLDSRSTLLMQEEKGFYKMQKLSETVTVLHLTRKLIVILKRLAITGRHKVFP